MIQQAFVSFWWAVCLGAGAVAQSPPIDQLMLPFYAPPEIKKAVNGSPVSATQAEADGPGLALTAVPRFGSFYSHQFVEGHVVNVAPATFKDYRIGVVVHREGLGHFSKPTCAEVLSELDSAGKFRVAAHTGGRDDLADRVIVFLLPATARIGCHDRGGDDIRDYETLAIARVDIARDDPYAQEISFAMLPFVIRDSATPVDPGQTVFRPDNVWLDAAGMLHLRTRTINGQRTGAEIISKQAFGRGRYIVEVLTSASTLPPSTVFGAYTWGYDPSNAHREGDIIEFSRFGTRATTAGVGTQPVTASTYRYFNQPDGCSRHEMVWGANKVQFASYDCSGKQIHEFTYNGVQPVRMDEKFRLNLWSLAGSSDLDAEVVIKSVRFEAEPRSGVTHVASTHYLNEHGLAQGAIVSAFALNSLATVTQGALSQPLPTTLGGTTVSVRDQIGNTKLAELLFVSPTQVNYIVPEGLAPGVADVIITNAKGEQFTGTIRINRVSPGIFTADATGRPGSIPAAFLQRVKADGTSVYEPLFKSESGQIVAVPIDPANGLEKLYLLLYATGVRQRQSLSTVRVLVGDDELPVEYAGPQSEYPGLDQLNVRIPAFYPKRGQQSVRLIVDGQVANLVTVLFR
jgi:uncharacterized protein (TIGR03437 family)